MLANEKPFTLWRKEWRARWLLLLALAALLPAVIAWLWISRVVSADLWVSGAFLIACAAFWVTWLAREERDPARAFLLTLPISRGVILRTKLRANFTMSIIFYFIFILCFALKPPPGHPEDISAPVAIIAGLPLSLITCIVALHFASPIVTLAVTCILAGVTIALMGLGCCWPETAFNDLRLGVFAWRSLSLSGLLLIYLYFLSTRTRLLELTPGYRFALFLLFGLGLIDLSILLFLTGWRDLAAALFGF